MRTPALVPAATTASPGRGSPASKNDYDDVGQCCVEASLVFQIATCDLDAGAAQIADLVRVTSQDPDRGPALAKSVAASRPTCRGW